MLFGSLSSAAAGPTCVPPKWATLICTQSFLVRFFKPQSALPIPFAFVVKQFFLNFFLKF